MQELEAINRIVEAAVMGWDLPERVLRLALDSYLYTALDFSHLDLFVAEAADQQLAGVAAIEPVNVADYPGQEGAMLLHGLYVLPAMQGQGVGTRLLKEAEQHVKAQGGNRLLVKAQKDAEGFFIGHGMQPVSVDNPAKQYAHLLGINIL